VRHRVDENAEHLGERGERRSRLPIKDGEHHFGEETVVAQRCHESLGHDFRVVAENTAPPRARHQALMPVRRGHPQHARRAGSGTPGQRVNR